MSSFIAKVPLGVALGVLPVAAIAQTMPSPVFNTMTATGSVTTPQANIGVSGYPSSGGAGIIGAYHADWPAVQTSIPGNGTQWQVYPNAYQGLAQTVSGTNQVVAVGASNPFLASWVGKNIYINTPNYTGWGSDTFTVVSVTDAAHMTVKNTSGAAVVWPDSGIYTWHYVLTTVDNTCNVIGTAVSYVSGQPFVEYPTTMTVNGTSYTASYVDQSHMTLGTSAGTQIGAACHQEFNDFDGLSLLRIQKTTGGNEEALAIVARAVGEYSIYSSEAGSGQYYPIVFYTGTTGPGIAPLLALVPNAASTYLAPLPGFVNIGGGIIGNNEAVQVVAGLNNINHVEMDGAPTGVAPSIRGRGTDPAVGVTFDTQSNGGFSFTSHSFGSLEFQIFGVGGTSYLSVGSSATDNPGFAAVGTDPNISINLLPKGTGAVQINGTSGVTCSGVPTASFAVVKGIVTHC